MYSTASAATESRIESYSRVPMATRTARRARPAGAVDRRAQRVLEHLPRAVRARPVKQLVADVPSVTMSSAMILAYTSATSCWRRRNSPWILIGPSLRGSIGSKISFIAEQVRDPADDHAADRQQPPLGHKCGDEHDRDPEQEAEDEAEVDHQPQLALADVGEHPVGELRLRLEVTR